MNKVLAIDPGIAKCGLVIADIKHKQVIQALVIKSTYLVTFVKKIYQEEDIINFLIGNGTSSQKYVEILKEFIPNIIVAEEKHSTYRAKQRFFEIFPLKGIKKILPREIFTLNKNLDALAALIILEDFYSCKFKMNKSISTKTWLK